MKQPVIKFSHRYPKLGILAGTNDEARLLDAQPLQLDRRESCFGGVFGLFRQAESVGERVPEGPSGLLVEVVVAGLPPLVDDEGQGPDGDQFLLVAPQDDRVRFLACKAPGPKPINPLGLGNLILPE